MHATEGPPRSLLALSLLVVAFAAGTTLRLWNLRAQVMGGDELHAVRAAVTRPLSGIVFTYQVSDNCIPLTLLDRLLMDGGVPLTEMLVRLPVLLAGLAMLVVAPWWAWRRLGVGLSDEKAAERVRLAGAERQRERSHDCLHVQPSRLALPS